MAAPQGRLRFFWGAAHSYRRYLLSPLVALKSNLVRFCLRFLEITRVRGRTRPFGSLAIGPEIRVLKKRVIYYELFFEQSM